MCGLSAVFSDRLTAKQIEAFGTLMLLSNLRGMEGAGIIGVTVPGKIYKHKTLGTGLDMLRDPSYHKLTSGKGDDTLTLLIGHTRFPTKGAALLKNTHPMDAKNVIGVHNGTMLDINGRFPPHNQSDSAMLYDAISDLGVEEAIKNSEGAYALLYVDKVKKTFNVLRNHQRPLYRAAVSEGDKIVAMFVSSEGNMLRYALGRAGIMNIEVKEIPTDTLMTFPLLPDGPEPTSKTICSVERWKRMGHAGGWTSSGRYVHNGPERGRDLKTTYVNSEGFRIFEYHDGTKSSVYVGRYSSTARTDKGGDRDGGIPFDPAKADSTSSAGPAGLVRSLAERMKSEAQARRKQAMPNAKQLALPAPPKEEPAAAKKSEEPPGFVEPYTKLSNGHFVSAAKLSELLQKGCAWCSQQTLGSEVSLGIRRPFFFNTEEYVCDDCKDIPDVVAFVGDWKKSS